MPEQQKLVPSDPGEQVIDAMRAIDDLDAERIEVLLDAGMTPHVHAPSGKSILEVAKEKVDALSAKANAGGSFTECQNSSKAKEILGRLASEALLENARHGDWDIGAMKNLLSLGADPNHNNNDESVTPLMGASHTGDVKALEVLLQAGADPNMVDKYGISPLMFASYSGNDDVIRKLLEKGADPNAQDRIGWSALMYAAADNHANAIQTLLGAGANPDLRENNAKRTALMLAAKHGYDEVARVLAEGGASVGLVDQSNQTALDIALDRASPTSKEGFRKIVDMLDPDSPTPSAPKDGGDSDDDDEGDDDGPGPVPA